VTGPAPDLSLLDGALLASVDAEQFDDTAMQECLSTLVDAGVEEEYPDPADVEAGERNPYVSASAACRNVSLFTAIAEAAGEELGYGTFQAAGESLTDVHLPGSEDLYNFGPYPSLDGDLPMFLFDWDPEEQAWVVREG
jgi:hypothetical protein